MRSSRSHFGQRRGQIVRANSAHDAKQGGKRSRRFHNVICLFRILVSKGVLASCLECAVSSFFHEKRKPLSGTILR